MHVTATSEPLTKRVRIVYDDGTSVECEMNAVLAASLRKMHWRDTKREKRHRKQVKTATDLQVHPESWSETQRLVHSHNPRLGLMLLGEGAIWDGPAAQWLRSDGEPCKPGEDPITGKRNGQRCRFCSHLETFPHNATCFNDGCTRERK